MTVTRRPYRMAARADSARATADRILDATTELFFERPTDRPSLEEVARRAGVAKQTILRRFGSKEALVTAAVERETERVSAERGGVVPGDVAGAVRAVVGHYERVGDGTMRMLAEEVRSPGVRAITDRGRAYHADWCARVFAPALEGRATADRDRALAQLIAVTDVYTWKLLRRDRGLSRRQTELALRELLEPLLGGPR